MLNETKPALPITVIILTNRTDERLTAAIQSVSWAKSILLIDTVGLPELEQFSPNPAIAIKKYPDPPTNNSINFSKIRNWSLQFVATPWVFFLDSDEVVTKESVPLITEMVQREGLDGIFVRRRDVFLGRLLQFGEVGNVRLMRLAKKKLIRFERPVHEIAQVSGNITQSQITLYHYSHPSIEEFISKIATYAYLEAHFRKQNQEPFSLFEAITFPKGKFLQNYFLWLGLLDGWRGLIYALMMSLHSLWTRVWLYELNKK